LINEIEIEIDCENSTLWKKKMKRLAKLSIVMEAIVLMVAFFIQLAMADPTISVRIGLPVVVELQSSPQPVWFEGCHY
jgi:hypothetical protein